jgi:hypothetical protein
MKTLTQKINGTPLYEQYKMMGSALVYKQHQWMIKQIRIPE